MIASESVANPSSQSYQKVDIVLSGAQKARITDYTNLRVKVIAGTPIETSCCPENPEDPPRKISPVLNAAFSNKTGGAVGLPDSVKLIYEESSERWYVGDFRPECLSPDSSWYIILKCQDGEWNSPAAATFYSTTMVSHACEPFQLKYDGNMDAIENCAAGTFTLTITEPST